MTNPIQNAVKAVAFDVYGTLVEIADKRDPFRQLLQRGVRQGRPVQRSDANTIMSSPLSLAEAAARLEIKLSQDDLAFLQNELDAEISSIKLFSDSLPSIRFLQQKGIRVALCSNLALDYAQPVLNLITPNLDAYIWSFSAGATKPDGAIYRRLCDALDCDARHVLMVGDTPAADVDGPRSFGMQSMFLDRRHRFPERKSITTLTDLFSLL